MRPVPTVLKVGCGKFPRTYQERHMTVVSQCQHSQVYVESAGTILSHCTVPCGPLACVLYACH